MPLTRGNVTYASRIMLPVHIVFSSWLGLAWLAQDSTRTAVPSLYALRGVWPIQNTGIVLVVVGVIALLGVLSHRRVVAAVALGMGALAYLILTGFIAWPLLSGAGSFSSPAWPLYVALAHFASMVSLARDTPNDHRGSAA